MMLLQAIWSADTKPLGLAAALLSFAGVTFGLTGCSSGVTSQLPSENTNVQARESTSRSWMKPTTKEPLIYVSTFPAQEIPTVDVFSWETHQFVGQLRDAVTPQTLCSDKAGDVFVPDYETSQIFEYAHGGTNPIAILKDTGHSPHACGSDRVTGNLAVVDSGGVAIYRNASGTPTRYTDSRFAGYSFCGYDDKGNLFVDGRKPSGHFVLAEMPNGQTTFTEITLEPGIFAPSVPRSVQWDGQYLVLGDTRANDAIRFKITGSTGTHQSTTYLDSGEGPIHQFWIPRFATVIPHATHIVAAQCYIAFRFDPGDVGFWGYPTGGEPRRLLVYPDHPIGVTVSVPAK